MDFKEITEEDLYKLYIIQNLTADEIALKYNTKTTTVRKKISKFNIKKDKRKCLEKVREACLKKYGVQNVSQLKETKDKVRETIKKKYGVNNISQLDEIKEKKKKKSLEKYGTDSVLQNPEIKKKIVETNLRKYGVENPQQSKEIKEKTLKNNLLKYGVSFPTQLDEVKEKIKNTNLKKYGFTSPLKNEKVKMKIKEEMIKKYGIVNILQSPEIKEKIVETNLQKYGVPYFCLTEKCKNSNGNIISKINKNFSKELLENGINNKLEKAIDEYSYDIEILNRNIVIEINPTYTHNISFGAEFRGHKKNPLNKDYHFQKSIIANKNGYRCIHIWDWDDKNKIINMLKPKEKIYARNCDYRKISKQECNKFLEENHLQGDCRGQKVMIGLFFKNKLIEVMTFGKPRYNKKYEWELLRLCSDYKYNIIGGANKLFKHFLTDYKPNSIISYCDNSKFNGNVYKCLGFIQENYGNPSKHWYNMKTKQHITDNLLRQRGYDQLFRTNFGKGTSNKELMIQNGFVEIYDCGQSKYIYKKSKA